MERFRVTVMIDTELPDRHDDAVGQEHAILDRLRDAGYLVVRWTDAELDAPSMLLRRVRAVLVAGPGRIVR